MNQMACFIDICCVGGVAVGATADMFITPLGAIIIGFTAGALSTWGFHYATVKFYIYIYIMYITVQVGLQRTTTL